MTESWMASKSARGPFDLAKGVRTPAASQSWMSVAVRMTADPVAIREFGL
jgi:hypothetical protein